MSNEANVTAIAEAVVAYIADRGYLDLGLHDNVEDCRDFARFLAARGVLAPAAICWSDISSFDDFLYPGGVEENTQEFRTTLERIAKGEQAD